MPGSAEEAGEAPLRITHHASRITYPSETTWAIDYSGINLNIEVILPELIVTVLAVVLIFTDLFMRGRQDKARVLGIVSIAGYAVALVACVLYFNNIIGSASFNTEAFNRMAVLDNLGLYFKMLALATAIVTVFLSMQFIRDKGLAIGEYYTVLALATAYELLR